MQIKTMDEIINNICQDTDYSHQTLMEKTSAFDVIDLFATQFSIDGATMSYYYARVYLIEDIHIAQGISTSILSKLDSTALAFVAGQTFGSIRSQVLSDEEIVKFCENAVSANISHSQCLDQLTPHLEVDDLLDLLSFAQSTNDTVYLNEIKERLFHLKSRTVMN